MLFIRVMSKAIIVIFLALAFAINVEAKRSENIVMCPATNKINQSASLMNHAGCREKYCSVSTDQPAFYENGLYWRISTGGIIASSEDEAILKAQTITAKASVMFSDVAWMGVICIYFVTSTDQLDDEMTAVVAFGLDQKNQFSLLRALLRN